ncbi:hypothetical protein FUAX_54100 (plasmid) [Fulvitalea axinellae]|uniref:Uncharacterized protein n=1 Tax=Fulvitalea axinellae TaxID=1182444 RepID=A0AAU9CYE0_9BACT|nr:hypothetical protein FUAX_54100 [Fulvitalea axinellae]
MGSPKRIATSNLVLPFARGETGHARVSTVYILEYVLNVMLVWIGAERFRSDIFCD